MKKMMLFFLMLFIDMNIAFAIDNAKVVMVINDQNHINKQIIIDNTDNQLAVRVPMSGKMPGSLFGYHVNLDNVNSNIKYNMRDNTIFLDNLVDQERVVINSEYDISYKQNDSYEYFEIIEGIDKNIESLIVQIVFEQGYEAEDLTVFINGKENRKYKGFVNDNTISIKFTDLRSNDVVGFRVKRSVKSSVSLLTIFSFVFPVVCLGFSYALWYYYGKDRRKEIEKRMNPVRQLSLIEVARLYNEEINRKDIISLIFSLCSKGFMQIEETKDDIRFVRLRNYTGHSYSEGLIFDAIFMKTFVGTFEEVINKKKKEYCTDISVKDVKIIRTMDRILANENMEKKKYEYFERDTSSKKNMIISMAIICLVLITINPFIAVNNSLFLLLALLIEFISFYVINKFIALIDFNRIRNYLVPVILTIILLLLIFAFIFGTNSIYEIAYLFGIVCVIGMLILAKYMPKRNAYGDKLYHNMEGFRKLLEEGTKEEYLSVLNTNENYYYDILSYIYIFGDKDYVSKRFKNVVKKECEWFKSYKRFDFNGFNKTCDVIVEVLMENNEHK